MDAESITAIGSLAALIVSGGPMAWVALGLFASSEIIGIWKGTKATGTIHGTVRVLKKLKRGR